MTLQLPDLPYSYDALKPYISIETLEIHHQKHHKAYVDVGNNLLSQQKNSLYNISLKNLVYKIWQDNDYKESKIFNQISQHWNHSEFWKMMHPKSHALIPSELSQKIIEDFGSIDGFKEEFIKVGMTQFGSGWVWLSLSNNEKLIIKAYPNAQNPLIYQETPLLGCDIWEHAYYIDYRNRRIDYLKIFINNLVNWENVTERFVTSL